MTDEVNADTPAALSPGEKLKQARMSAGLSAEDLAKRLYVKAAEIEAIESDVVDTSKSLTFTKGYVKNYAKTVGLDVDAITSEFDRYHQNVKQSAKLQSFSRRVSKEANDNRWMMLTYVILLVIIGAVVWWWLQQPDSSLGTRLSPSSPDSSQEAPPAQAQSATQTKVDDTLNEQLTSAPELSAQLLPSVTLNNNEVTPESITQVKDIEEPPVASAEVAQAEAEQVDSSLVPLVFTFSQDCWVNIIDNTGEAIAFGVKKAGLVMQVEGIPPFNVTLGVPQGVGIEYDGETIDMSGFTGNQIGRLVLPLQG